MLLIYESSFNHLSNITTKLRAIHDIEMLMSPTLMFRLSKLCFKNEEHYCYLCGDHIFFIYFVPVQLNYLSDNAIKQLKEVTIHILVYILTLGYGFTRFTASIHMWI